MFPISRTIERSSVRGASLALAAVALLAACDTDRAVEPKIPTVPTETSPIVRTTTGALAWRVVDVNSNPIGGAQFKVVGQTKATWIITDNGPGDADPAPGQFKLTGLIPGRYSTCETVPPAKYVLPAKQCASADVALGVTTTLADFQNLGLPIFLTDFSDFRSNLAPGGSITIKDSLGAVIMTVVDDDATDENKTGGKIQLTLPAAGKYSVCELMPPPNYVFPPNQVVFCVPFTAWVNGSNHVSWSVNPLGSIYWAVVDGFYPPNNTPGYVGPSSFKITSADGGSFSMDVVDQGVNDLDNQVGRLYATVPGPGTYVVCETVAVPNHYMANPSCHTVDVLLGVPKWADYFINGEKQVIYNP